MIIFDRSQGRVVYLLHTNIQKSCKKRCVNNESTVLKSNSWIFLWNLNVIIFVRVSGSLRFFWFMSYAMSCYSTTLLYSYTGYTCRSHETLVISTKTRVIATDPSGISFSYPGIFVPSNATRTNRSNPATWWSTRNCTMLFPGLPMGPLGNLKETCRESPIANFIMTIQKQAVLCGLLIVAPMWACEINTCIWRICTG